MMTAANGKLPLGHDVLAKQQPHDHAVALHDGEAVDERAARMIHEVERFRRRHVRDAATGWLVAMV